MAGFPATASTNTRNPVTKFNAPVALTDLFHEIKVGAIRVSELDGTTSILVGADSSGYLISGVTLSPTLTGLTLSGLVGTGTRLATWSSTGVAGALTLGTANQILGVNAGATANEYKGVTATSAGAVAGVTTLGAVGPVTLSAGGISVADTYGMYSSISGTDRNLIRRNSATLELGVNGGWTQATYTIASGSHIFAIGAINYFQCSTSLFQTAIDAQINGTFRATGAGQFDTTLLTTGTARFSSRVGIGAASNAAYNLYIAGAITSGTTQYGMFLDTTVGADALSFARGASFRVNLPAALGTTFCDTIVVEPPILGAGASITNLKGIYINSMTGGTNNYGLYVDTVSGGTINRAIHTAGGDHVFVGNVRIGSTTAATVALDVTGAALISSTLGVTGTLTGGISNWSGLMTISSGGLLVSSGGINSSTTLDVSGLTYLKDNVRINDNSAAAQLGALYMIEVARTASAGIAVLCYGTGSVVPALTAGHARGTPGAEAAVQSGDALAYMEAAGHTGSAWSGNMWARVNATETWSGTARGYEILMSVIAITTTTARQMVSIRADDVQIGNATSNPTIQLLGTGLVSTGGALTVTGLLTANGGITLGAGDNIALATSTGTKLGTATTQLLGFWNATPVDQPAHIADPSGGAVQDAEARTAINAINAMMAETGLTAAS